MLSRVADNLYWFGRYLQRAENTARLINVNTILLLDLPRGIRLGWEPLIGFDGACGHRQAALVIAEAFAAHPLRPKPIDLPRLAQLATCPPVPRPPGHFGQDPRLFHPLDQPLAATKLVPVSALTSVTDTIGWR